MKSLSKITRKIGGLILGSGIALGLSLAMTCWMPIKAAIPGAAGDGVVNPSFGSYGAAVEIEVPDYYELEPELKLVYNSGGSNGMVGVGWGLAGADSFLERTSAQGDGAPKYDATDVFLLDGVKLLPSTDLGGTHVTERQSYLRITQDTMNNQWYVWEKDGTKKTYTSLYTIGSGFNNVFRWALSTVQDTNGNTVTYNYWTDPSQNCYLDNITYNGYTIKFWRESRPDVISFANGSFVGHTNYRLKTIEVKAGNNPINAYKLTYTTSANSGRSLLTCLQEYGSDVVIDTAGTICGGTSLPAETMSYSDPATSLYPVGIGHNSVISNWNTTWKYQLAEVNGDGKLDAVVIYKHAGDGNAHAFVRLGDGTGKFSAAAIDSVISNWNTTWIYQLVDVNGDGMQDSVTFYQKATDDDAHAWVRLATGDGKFSRTALDSVISGWNTTWKYLLADVNGDGITDAVVIYKKASDGNAHAFVRLGDGKGKFSTAAIDSTIANWDTTWKYLLADVNGDGMQDSVTFYKKASDGKAHAWVRLATGGGKFSTTPFDTAISTWNTSFTYTLSDVNGDGMQDAVVIYKHYTDGLAHIWVKLATGRGDFCVSAFDDTAIGTFNTDFNYQLADVNGDGIEDIVDIYKKYSDGKAHAWIKLGTPTGFNSWGIDMTIGTWNTDFKYLLYDVNGDGRTDIVDIYKDAKDGYAHASVKLSERVTTHVPDLLITMTNGMGGTTNITYTPSSVWPSQYTSRGGIFQTVSQVKVSDGRGNIGITSYSYKDANYAIDNKTFFGFAYQKAVINDQGTYVETYNRQTVQSMGQADAVYTKDSAGNIFGYNTYTYTEGGDGNTTPYTSLVAQTSEYECNLTDKSRQSRTSYLFDQFGNQTEVVHEGDIDLTADELLKVNTYNYNTDAYIVDCVKSETIYSGTTIVNYNKADESLYYYDDATNISAPPVKGNLTRSDSWNNETGGYVSASGVYDSYGNKVSATDTRGAMEKTTFDPIYHKYPITETNALGHTTTWTWDYVHGVPLAVTDADGNTTSFSCDALGRQISQTDAAGNVTTIEYSDTGDPNKQCVRKIMSDGSSDGLWEETYTDGIGRVYKVIKKGPTAEANYIRETVYNDTDSSPQKTSLWYKTGETPAWETYEYDGIGRLTKTTHADGFYAMITYGMDENNKPYTITVDELGHEQATWIDTKEQVTKIRERNGAVDYYTYYTYDVMGNRIQVKDANNNISTYKYNSLKQLTSMTDVDLGTVSYTYDNGGLVLTETDAKGQTITCVYDILGRIISKKAGGQSTRWYYDEAGHGASKGNLTRIVYPSGSESYIYNSLNQVTSVTQTIGSISKTMTTTYDSLGRMATITYPDGETITYNYGTDGNLYSVSGYVDSMTYGANGELTRMVYANGTVAEYTYDPQRLWLDTAKVSFNGTTLYTASYTYNALQMVTGMTQGTPLPQTTIYTYDDLGRLKSANGPEAQSFTYDAIGNMTYNSRIGGYTYGDAAHKHAATKAGTANYTYDANGNMLTGNGKIFTWDAEDRLTSVTQGTTVTSFTYTDGSRRLSKNQGANTTLYFSSLLERDNGSDIQYYYAGSILVAKKDAAGTKTWYHADRLGSIRLMTNADGAEVKDYDYRPFGEILAESGAMANERGFTGQIRDAETGLMYYNARYYDPVLCKFVSADTAVQNEDNPQDLNAYSYCANNPINNTDPTGHIRVFSGMQRFVTFKKQTITKSITVKIPYIIIYPTLEFYWKCISVSKTIFGKTFSKSFTIPATRVVWHRKTGFYTIHRIISITITVPIVQFKAIYKEVRDTARKAVHKVAKTVKKVIKATGKAAKSAGRAVAKAAKATKNWCDEHTDELWTVALVVGVVALTVASGGFGASLGVAALTARCLGGAVSAGAAVWVGMKDGKSMSQIAFDAAAQGVLGFASVGAGQVIGKTSYLPKIALGGKALKAAEWGAGFGAAMAFNSAKDMANNAASGKSAGESWKATYQGAALGGVLTGGIFLSPGRYGNPYAVGTATAVGSIGAQYFRQ